MSSADEEVLEILLGHPESDKSTELRCAMRGEDEDSAGPDLRGVPLQDVAFEPGSSFPITLLTPQRRPQVPYDSLINLVCVLPHR